MYASFIIFYSQISMHTFNMKEKKNDDDLILFIFFSKYLK